MLNKKTTNNWEKEVEEQYAKKEYSGIYESILHARMTLVYMESKNGKKIVIDELGEIAYTEQVNIMKTKLKLRKIELEVLKKTLNG